MDLALVLALLLSHPSFAVREQSLDALSRMDCLALPALHWVETNGQPHARHLAAGLVMSINGRATLQLMEDARAFPWICSYPGRDKLWIGSYLERARMYIPMLTDDWGEPRLDAAFDDWLGHKIACLLWVRETRQPPEVLEEMRQRCEHWRRFNKYPD